MRLPEYGIDAALTGGATARARAMFIARYR